MAFPKSGSRAFRYLMVTALFFVVIIGVKMTSYIVNLFVISLILTMLALPALDLLKKRGVPDILSVSIITTVAGMIVLALLFLMFYSFEVLVHDLPLYQAELDQRITEVASLLNGFGISSGPVSASAPSLSAIAGMIVSSVASFGESLMFLFFIAVTTFFMLLEAPRISARFEKIFGRSSEKSEDLSRMGRYMIDFVVVRTETNLIHGILFGGFLWFLGVHAAILWGILTFLLGYIPYIGLFIAAIPAIFFAWLQFGWWGAAVVIAAICILNLIVENPVYSHLASRKFDMPALLVILSVIFWGWLLGIFGMVFAVPITLIIIILIQNDEELRWVNTLLGVDQLFEEGRHEKTKQGAE
jgi:predicted PurR-regulated permease PerM